LNSFPAFGFPFSLLLAALAVCTALTFFSFSPFERERKKAVAAL